MFAGLYSQTRVPRTIEYTQGVLYLLSNFLIRTKDSKLVVVQTLA